MKLWLYSSGDFESNAHIDEKLLQQINRKKPELCFIPSSHEDADYYLEEFIERFNEHGPCNISVLTIDTDFTKKDLSRALSADMIYLSGGNTFYFMKHLRTSGVENELYEYASRGGILAGHSAGAIVMTPNINTASYPQEDRDDNSVGLLSMKAMRFCSFEVFPHYLVRSRSHNAALHTASETISHVIYALPDGAAVAVDGEAVTAFGPAWGFSGGVRFNVKA